MSISVASVLPPVESRPNVPPDAPRAAQSPPTQGAASFGDLLAAAANAGARPPAAAPSAPAGQSADAGAHACCGSDTSTQSA